MKLSKKHRTPETIYRLRAYFSIWRAYTSHLEDYKATGNRASYKAMLELDSLVHNAYLNLGWLQPLALHLA